MFYQFLIRGENKRKDIIQDIEDLLQGMACVNDLKPRAMQYSSGPSVPLGRFLDPRTVHVAYSSLSCLLPHGVLPDLWPTLTALHYIRHELILSLQRTTTFTELEVTPSSPSTSEQARSGRGALSPKQVNLRLLRLRAKLRRQHSKGRSRKPSSRVEVTQSQRLVKESMITRIPLTFHEKKPKQRQHSRRCALTSSWKPYLWSYR